MKLVNVHLRLILVAAILVGAQTLHAQVWSLQQCMDSAFVHNKSLQINRNNVLISSYKQQEAKANLIPKAVINSDYKYFTNLPYQLMPLSIFGGPAGQFKEAQFGVPHNFNANVQVSFPIYNPTVYGAIQNTKIAGEIAEIQVLKSEEQVFFYLSNLYYNAQILHAQLDFIDSNLKNARFVLRNSEALYSQLLAKQTDVSKVKLEISNLTMLQESVAGKYTQVLNELKNTMGLALSQNIELEAINASAATKEYARQQNLDSKLIQMQNKFLQSELKTLNNSRFIPSLQAIASYGTTGYGYDKEPNRFFNFYPIGFAGVQLSYPLFNGTVTLQKVNQKKIELQNNELQFEQQQDATSVQIENAHLQFKLAKKLIETRKEHTELATSIYHQTILQQREGLASLTDVLLADNSVREAQQNYLAAVIDFFKADLELKKLTGNISTQN